MSTERSPSVSLHESPFSVFQQLIKRHSGQTPLTDCSASRLSPHPSPRLLSPHLIWFWLDPPFPPFLLQQQTTPPTRPKSSSRSSREPSTAPTMSATRLYPVDARERTVSVRALKGRAVRGLPEKHRIRYWESGHQQ